MRRGAAVVLAGAVAAGVTALLAGEAPGLVLVTATNPLPSARPAETLTLTAAQLAGAIPVDDFRRIHVSDDSGREMVTQVIDLDGDGHGEAIVFQADFAPEGRRRFHLSLGDQRPPTRADFRAYGRFVRERFDDFAWENDRIAFRMYGRALETWPQEPLTSSGVDVWVKRVSRMVVNDWYMVDDYHRDAGEGGDLYSVGKSRGCGGSGLWSAGQLHVSRNFVDSKVLANGPLRVVFELTYPPFDVAGRAISEVKRVSLDAGQNLSRFESRYSGAGEEPLMQAVGIKRSPGSSLAVNRAEGWMRTWEPLKGAGQLGCAVILGPAFQEATEADGNYLVVGSVGTNGVAVHYAGFGWDQSGQFAGLADWTAYVATFAARLKAPVKVTVAKE